MAINRDSFGWANPREVFGTISKGNTGWETRYAPLVDSEEYKFLEAACKEMVRLNIKPEELIGILKRIPDDK
jgi:hypothetical protein